MALLRFNFLCYHELVNKIVNIIANVEQDKYKFILV